MQATCPHCGRPIDAEHMNVATDVAVCATCDGTFKLSDLVAAGGAGPAIQLNQPPPGAWYRGMFDGFEVGATTRHPMAIFLVPFALVWSGGSLGGIYGSQIWSGEFSVVLCLFGIPFLIGSVFLWAITLMALCGKAVVTVDRDQGEVFVGVGSTGRRRRFVWSEISRITEAVMPMQSPGGYMGTVCLEGKTRIRFGTMLREERRYFVAEALRRMLAERDSRRRSSHR